MARKARKGKGIRRSRHEWQALLAKLERGGLGVGAFCRREAISAASLYRWRRLLSEGDAGSAAVVAAGDTAPAFVDLGPLSAASASRLRLDLKLDLGDGLTLHLVRH